MGRRLSLAFLTLFDAGPVEAIRAAARAGFDMVGLRLLPAAPGEAPHRILTDDRLARTVEAELKASGIGVADVEIVRLGAATRVNDVRPFMERAAQLRARHVLVAGDDPDETRLTDNFAALCGLAAGYGLTCDLEFMPWTQVRRLADAHRIVARAGAANAGVLIDALHWDRAGDTAEAVAALPPALLHFAQFCDGPRDYGRSDEELVHLARTARLFPGEGDIDLAALARALPPDIPISVEVIHRERARRLDPDQRAALAYRSVRACLEHAGRTAG